MSELIKNTNELIKILVRLEILDYSGVSGCYIWLPYGNKLLLEIEELLKSKVPEYQQMRLPTLLSCEDARLDPHSHMILKQDSFSVNQEKCYLKPTSEMILYPYLAKKLKSWKHLPCRVYALGSVFRRENGVTPGIRHQEISSFFEKHAVLPDEVETVAEVEKLVKVYSQLFTDLGIPYSLVTRYTQDCFPNAVSSIAFDTIVAGKSLQIGTVHNLGVNFCVPVKMKYNSRENTEQYPHICCAGLSERVLTSMIYYNMSSNSQGLFLKVPPCLRRKHSIFDVKYFSAEQIKSIVCEYPDVFQEHITSSGLHSSNIKHELMKGFRFILKKKNKLYLSVDNYESEYKESEDLSEIISWIKTRAWPKLAKKIHMVELTLAEFLNRGIPSDSGKHLIKIKLKDVMRLQELEFIRNVIIRQGSKMKILGYDSENYVHLANKY
jgi:prolyl-tRNA synthetase